MNEKKVIIPNERLLFFDTETGGLPDMDISLLSMGFVAWCPHQGTLGSLHLPVKEPILKVTQTALEVNGIDMLEHFKTAYTYQQAREHLIHFCTSNKLLSLPVLTGMEKYPRVKLAGWNVGSFDLGFLKDFFYSQGEFYKKLFLGFFDYHVVDLPGIMRLLFDLSLVPKDFSSSSDDAFEYFEIERPEAHNNPVNCCLGDITLYEKVLELIHEKSNKLHSK